MATITIDKVDAACSSVAIKDGANQLDIDASGFITANVNGTVTVSATDLDIRDLINTQDSIAIGDEVDIIDLQLIGGTFDAAPQTFAISGVVQNSGIFAGVAAGEACPLHFNDMGELRVQADLSSDVDDDDADAGGPVKIGGRGVDQGSALTALSAANDRFDLLGDLYRRLFVNTSAHVGGTTVGATTSGTADTATQADATKQAGRMRVTLQNTSSTDSIYYGYANTVTTSGATKGIEIPPCCSADIPAGEAVDIWVISGGTSVPYTIDQLG